MVKGVSIIICCFNSAKLLPDTLDSIFRLHIPEGIPSEIIIIDNNSTDNTYSTAEKILSEYSLSKKNNKFEFRILKQPEQGLSHSRWMGIENARYEYLILCDDDNHLHKDYLTKCCRIMDSDPETAVLGGESIPVSSADFPEWFEMFSKSYAAGSQYDFDGDVTSEGAGIWGAGMVLRSSAIKGIISESFKSLLSDRRGDKLSSGGDIEMCYALRLAGWKIRHESSLKLDHYIHPDKLKWNYLLKLSKGFGVQKVYLDAYLKSDKPDSEIKWKDEARRIIGKLKKTGVLKTAGYKFLKEGNPDLLKIEKLTGKLFELYKIKDKYTLNIEKVRIATWNKESKFYKANLNQK